MVFRVGILSVSPFKIRNILKYSSFFNVFAATTACMKSLIAIYILLSLHFDVLLFFCLCVYF